jgi:hypothetical protein
MMTVRAAQTVERTAIFLALAACVGCLLFIGPFATNDGPVHMSFARMFWFGLAGPLQTHLYMINRELDPNLLGYLIAGPAIAIVGADWAEIILQAICLISLPLAGWFVMSTLRSGNMAWVGVMAAMSLNEMFFLGLYNYSLSLSAGLLAFGMLVRAEREGGYWWAGFGAALVIAFLSHPGGLILGVIFTMSWLVPRIMNDAMNGVSVRALVARNWPIALSMLPALLFVIQFLARQVHHETLRGPGLNYRLHQILSLNLLATNGPPTVLAARGVAALVIGATLVAMIERLRRWRGDPASRLDTVRYGLLVLSGLVLVAAFPDVAGGGWTHIRRMVLLPFLAALLICAVHPWTVKTRMVIVACIGILNAVVIGSALREQIPIHRVVADADQLLGHVEAHCTVLPIIPYPSLQTVSPPLPTMSPWYMRVSRTSYTPFSHIATRLEQRGDRVALYNYLARLGIYPISARPGLDPQQLIFHWAPDYWGGAIEVADLQSFERAAGIPVDYVLLQGDPMEMPPGLGAAVRNYHLVTTSGTSGFRLYARDGTNCGSQQARYVAHPLPAETRR